MEKLLRDIKYLLAFVAVLLLVIATCQVFLVAERLNPSRAEAESKLPAQKVDLVKIGGRNVFLYDFIEKPY